MSKIQQLTEKAKKEKRTIVLPEGNDIRVVKAASIAASQDIANIILLGNKDTITISANENNIDVTKVKIIDPYAHEKTDEFSKLFYELRKHKGITEEEAKKIVTGNSVYFAGLMVRESLADGFVAGAFHTSGDVAKAGIYCVGLDRKIGLLTSCFVVELPDKTFGYEGLFIYGDCGVITYPVAKQLAGIAIACSDVIEKLFDIKARTALLSFSTKGSAQGESIDKVREALQKIKEKRPDILVDGELQVDAAILPEVAKKKCKDSPVEGKANVLIFPDLDAGNICYKITQRLAKARVIGPVLLGLKSPCCDLSRGCGVEEIVDAIALTAVRAQGKEC
ncbi:MAG: phosphate acetyltransferase [Candidatus Omnitrophica bacterium]|nr:phosphate acetyltransferase [Candidatus Omnitrophota bacterium]